MSEQTCGKGLAEHSVLPSKLAAVAAAMAAMLEQHRTSLDVADPNGSGEDAAYATLANDFRGIAALLSATAGRMAGYRDLPMAPHDEAALMSAEAVEKFEGLVRAERELLDMLQGFMQMYEAMLAAMRGGA